jgi:hypothetical protein
MGKELRFWFNTPKTIKYKGVTFRLFGDGRHYSKKGAIKVVKNLRRNGEFYVTTRRWRDGTGNLTGNVIIYVRKKHLGLGGKG